MNPKLDRQKDEYYYQIGLQKLFDASDDPVVKPDRTAALVAAMPAASRTTLDGLGHAPYLENPEAYNRALTEFIQEN